MELSERDRVMRLVDFIHGVRVAYLGEDEAYNSYVDVLRHEAQ